MKKSAENEKISWFYDRFGMCMSRAFQRGIARLCSIKNKKRLKKYSVCICCIRLKVQKHTRVKNWNSGPRCPKILFFTILESGTKVEQVLFTKNWCQLFVYIFDLCQPHLTENRVKKSGIEKFAPGGFSQNLFTKYLLVRPLIWGITHQDIPNFR